MKKIIILFIVFGLISCEDVLDKRSLNKIDSDDVWEDVNLANMYLNELYAINIPGFSATSNASLSDESTGSGEGDMMYGSLTIDDSYGHYSKATYNKIRKLNILIENIRTGTMSDDDQNKIIGQTYFLRAWTYWELVKLYGGVPMIMKNLDPEVDDLYVKRNSAKECIELIVDDLDKAIGLLDIEQYPDVRGRITRGAAAALKGRVLLFYASPQFNPNNLIDRWQMAYDANKNAKEICEFDGYSLYRYYSDIFLAEDDANEAIFVTIYDGIERSHGYENSVRPASERNSTSSGTQPTWQLVSAYPMADGYMPGESPNYTYNEDYFWQNRDPRFYATIAYNGCVWPLSDQVGRKQWNYTGSTSENVKNTNTGFYCRRNVNAKVIRTETPRIATDWIEIRYAEVLLNLAECAAELDLLTEAQDELEAIRERAGIEQGNGNFGITALNKEEMIEAIMHERQIEFAFENKRHWDLRRRNLFLEKLNGTRRSGINTTVIYPDSIYIVDTATGDVDSGKYETNYMTFFNNNVVDTINLENSYYKYFQTEFNVETDQKDINYLQPKYNFYFVPFAVLDKNPNIQQTIYWSDINPFDPLAN